MGANLWALERWWSVGVVVVWQGWQCGDGMSVAVRWWCGGGGGGGGVVEVGGGGVSEGAPPLPSSPQSLTLLVTSGH